MELNKELNEAKETIDRLNSEYANEKLRRMEEHTKLTKVIVNLKEEKKGFQLQNNALNVKLVTAKNDIEDLKHRLCRSMGFKVDEFDRDLGFRSDIRHEAVQPPLISTRSSVNKQYHKTMDS